jgi:hypothetical protein
VKTLRDLFAVGQSTSLVCKGSRVRSELFNKSQNKEVITNVKPIKSYFINSIGIELKPEFRRLALSASSRSVTDRVSFRDVACD